MQTPGFYQSAQRFPPGVAVSLLTPVSARETGCTGLHWGEGATFHAIYIQFLSVFGHTAKATLMVKYGGDELDHIHC